MRSCQDDVSPRCGPTPEPVLHHTSHCPEAIRALWFDHAMKAIEQAVSEQDIVEQAWAMTAADS